VSRYGPNLRFRNTLSTTAPASGSGDS
jgi:hypothetical protein